MFCLLTGLFLKLPNKLTICNASNMGNSSKYNLLSTRSLNRLSVILHLNRNEIDCNVLCKISNLSSNMLKGGKLYEKSEIKNSERNFGTYQAEGQQNCDYLQFYKAIMSQRNYSFFHSWEKGATQLRRITCIFAYKRRKRMNVNIESIIAAETKRISTEYGKSFLDCDDIVVLTGLGRDNVRALMKSKSFPLIQVGKRQVVSIVAFVTWQMNVYCNGDNSYGKF